MDHPLAPTSIASEFRPIDQLEQILGNHSNWKRIQVKIRDRIEYHTTPIEDKICITDLHHRLLKGNHKSELGKRATIFSTKLSKESKKGWCIPILPNYAIEISNLEIALLGLAHQASINECGEIIEKDRFTHDLFPPGIASENFIHKRMDMGKFAETHDGHMRKRLLHRIVNMRANDPTTRILIEKRQFQNRLSTATLVSTIRNPVGNSDQLKGSIVLTHINKTHFWWSKWTRKMEHNYQTN